MSYLLKSFFSLRSLLVVVLALCLQFTACHAPQKVIYFQDVENSIEHDSIAQSYNYKIQPDDQFSIIVNSKFPELSLPFNLTIVSYQTGSSGNFSGTQQQQGYIVDAEGYINFPIFGKIKAAGLSRTELVDYLEQRLKTEGYINDVVVTVTPMNYSISIMGEVVRPGKYAYYTDKISILEALSMAGDLTIYGKRDRVAVIREEDGIRTMNYLDIKSKKIFESPYFYMQPNDIVYVEPNKRKAGMSEINQNNSAAIWISVTATLVSVATLIISIIK